MTSQMSIPIFMNVIFNSFISAILTARNVFSTSFVASAAWVEETGTVRTTICWYTFSAAARPAGEVEPTTLGMVSVVKSVRLGSSRSGENATKKSLSTFNPFFSRIGTITSTVVPGYVVDSRTISWSGRTYGAIASHVRTMNDMSGSRFLLRGVGTAIRIASHSFAREKSVVDCSSPDAAAFATRATGICLI